MINYVIESSICLGCFYGFYWLFLSREKLLSINRFYLLTTAILSLCIPLLNFDFQIGVFAPLELLSSKTTVTTPNDVQSLETSSPFFSLASIYFIGLLAATGLLLIKLVILKRRLGNGLSFKSKQVEIAETDGLNAYSFFNTIFIGKDLNANSNLKEHIIAHELAHIEGKHSLDLLFFELLQCIYWFNPFSYFYTKSIKLQHEYIADHRALEATSPKHYERSLLELTLSKVNSSLISNFSEHPIQKRLKMIQKLNSNVMNKLKPALAVPVLAILLIAFACTEEIEPLDALLDSKSETETPLDVDLNVIVETEVEDGNTFEYKEYILETVLDQSKNQYKYKLRLEDGLHTDPNAEVLERWVERPQYVELEIPVDKSNLTIYDQKEVILERALKSTFKLKEVAKKKH